MARRPVSLGRNSLFHHHLERVVPAQRINSTRLEKSTWCIHTSSAPLLFAFLASWGIKRSSTLQTMVLNDGRSVNEVKGFLSLLQIVSAFLLVVFATLLLTGAIG